MPVFAVRGTGKSAHPPEKLLFTGSGILCETSVRYEFW